MKRMVLSGDPQIKVYVTGPEEDGCIGFAIYHMRFSAHTLSAIDLRDKINEALDEWLEKSVKYLDPATVAHLKAEIMRGRK